MVGATGPLTVDPTGNPVWLASTPSGDAAVKTLIAGDEIQIRALPDPAFERFYWTSGGLLALRSTGTDAYDVVSIGLEGRLAIDPLDPPEANLVDAAIGPSGRVATARAGSGKASILTFNSDVGTASTTLETRPRQLEVWEAARQVLFFGGSAIVQRWDTSTGTIQSLTDNDAYADAVSPEGKLAYSRFTDSGPMLDVCIVSLTPTP